MNSAIKPAQEHFQRTDSRPAKVSAPLQNPTSRKLSVHDIRARAYAIYQLRQAIGQTGDAESDWLEAERELRATSRG